MQAIIKSGSRQYQVQPETIIEVNRLPLEEGAAFETDQVLMYNKDDKDIRIGAPYVEGATVTGKVLGHLRGKKIVIFKMKRRKNYRRTKGHRQELTRVLIESINLGKATGAKATPAKATEPKATEALATGATAPAAEAKPAKAPAVKSTPAESAEAKAPAAKAPVKKAAAAKETAAKDTAAKETAAKDTATKETTTE